MGLFKKLGRKLKGFFKRIGKGIKKGFKKFGKFMGKIGVLGQIAMMFILPAVGGLMLRGLGAVTGLGASSAIGTAAGFTQAAAGASGLGGTIAKGVAWTLKTAQGFANSPLLKPFKTVTDAVNGFMKNTVGYVGSKVGLGNLGKAGGDWANFFEKAPDDFWGTGTNSVLGRVGESVTTNWEAFTGDLEKGNILMGGDTSLQKAWDQGKALKLDKELNMHRNISMIEGVPTDEMFAMNTSGDVLDGSMRELADARIANKNLSAFPDVDLSNAKTFDASSFATETLNIPAADAQKSWISKLGEGVQDTLWKGEESLLQNLRPKNMLGKVGEGIAEIPGTMVKQSLLAPLMGGGGGGGSYWGSTAGPVSTPGRDRAEQYAYANAMASAGAASQYFSSDYDIFTAVQNEANPYGTDMGGTWGNYMSRPLGTAA